MNLIGLIFDRLTVIEKSVKKYHWLCRCSCGTIKSIDQNSLRRHRTKSCGCLRKETLKNHKPSHKKQICVGQQFNLLTILYEIEKDDYGHRRFMCKCKCGNTVIVSSLYRLASGRQKSCGCYIKNLLKNGDTNRKHGKRHTPEYNLYMHILGRCCNPNDQSFHDYGGRGIKICDRWKKSFVDFYADLTESIGTKPSVYYSLDRIDVNGDYEPNNVKWSTDSEQANNTRRNVFITCNGKTQTLSLWSKETGVNRVTIQRRLSKGWPTELALTLPASYRHRPNMRKNK